MDTVMGWLGWAVTGLLLVRYRNAWFATRELFRSVPWRVSVQMLRFSWCTPHAAVLVVATLGGSCLSFGARAVLGLPFGISALLLTAGLGPLVMVARPPAIVLLTTSTRESARIFEFVRLAVAPLRCVALLANQNIGSSSALELSGDNLRSRNGRIWKSIVRDLVEIAPVVVMDARPASGGVMYEAFLMLDPSRAPKTLWVLGAEGACPALRNNGIDPDVYALRTTTEKALIPDLDRVLFEYRASTDGRPLPRIRKELVPDDWDHLPSVLAYQAVERFDGAEAVQSVLRSGKDLLEVITPFAALNAPHPAVHAARRFMNTLAGTASRRGLICRHALISREGGLRV